MEDSKVQETRLIFTDVWEFFKRNRNPVDTAESWRSILDDMSATAKKHGNSEFCQNLLLATMREIENISNGDGTLKGGR